MTLPSDWRFNQDHRGLDESGVVGTGDETLADWACTMALTEPGGLPEDGSFGAGLGSRLIGGVSDPQSVGASLRGYLLNDPRVEEVALDGSTLSGTLVLPVVVTPADEPYRLAGPLTAELIEEIIADMGLEDGEEA
jgi:hypothetical protein